MRQLIGSNPLPDWLNIRPPRPFGNPSHGQGLSTHMPLEFSTLNRVRVGVPPMSFTEHLQPSAWGPGLRYINSSPY